MSSFIDKISAKWNEGKFVCVGLDKGDFEFDKKIIDQTADLVCAYKPNIAFYEAEGISGLESLKQSIDYIHQNHPDIPVILDAKRADIGNTNEACARAIFDNLAADAITLNPYLGKEALKPFLDRSDKGLIILVKTSNPGASEFQDLLVDGKPLYQIVAQHIANQWNTNNNCAVVVGATYPEELKIVREIVGDLPILVPGIGAQGGSLEDTLKNGLNSKKQGLIISSSRGIIFAPDPRQAALKMTNEIQSHLSSPTPTKSSVLDKIGT